MTKGLESSLLALALLRWEVEEIPYRVKFLANLAIMRNEKAVEDSSYRLKKKWLREKTTFSVQAYREIKRHNALQNLVPPSRVNELRLH